MHRVLLEKVWLLAGVWFAVQFVLIAIWSRRRTRRTMFVAWGGFAALPLLIALSILVVTQRERVIALCESLAGFVDDGNVPAIAMRLTDDCMADSRDRAAFLADLERGLSEYRVDDPNLSRFQVDFQNDSHGTVTFTASGRVRSPDFGSNWMITRWRLDVRREGEDWRVCRIESRPGGTPGVGNVLDLVR